MKESEARRLATQARKEYLERNPLKKAGQPFKKTFDIGRNAPCPCNSGKKFKKCCMIVQPISGQSAD